MAKSGVDAGDIKAIAISGLYGGSGIPLDENMKPVRPCMIWMDRRAQRESDWALEAIGEQRLLEEKKRVLEQEFEADIRVMARAPVPVSSTGVRGGGDLDRLVPPAVAAYIRKHQLYDRKNGK